MPAVKSEPSIAAGSVTPPAKKEKSQTPSEQDARNSQFMNKQGKVKRAYKKPLLILKHNVSLI